MKIPHVKIWMMLMVGRHFGVGGARVPGVKTTDNLQVVLKRVRMIWRLFGMGGAGMS